jgi:hypothetical protein
LFTGLAQTTGIGAAEVIGCAGWAIARLEIADILATLKGIIARYPAAAKEVTAGVLHEIAVGRRKLIPTVIVSCWERATDKCPFFVEYGYVMKALQTAVEANAREWIPVIAFTAVKVGNPHVTRECERILG